MIRPCDLAMSGAGGEARSDGDEKRGTLEVVGGGEGRPRARAFAVEAAEARDASAIAGFRVIAVPMEASSGSSMGHAIGPGAKGGTEAGGTHRFGGLSWPTHGRMEEQARGRKKTLGTPELR